MKNHKNLKPPEETIEFMNENFLPYDLLCKNIC